MSAQDEDEWREDDDAYDSDTDALVHPLPKVDEEKPTGEVNRVHDDVKQRGGSGNATSKKAVESAVEKPHYRGRAASVLSATTGSDGGSETSEVANEAPPPRTEYAEEVVRLHARRADGCVPNASAVLSAPPPAPLYQDTDDIGVEASIEARKRVTDYCRRMAQRQEAEKAEKARDAESAKQARARYKDFNRAIGVADIPPDTRFKDAMSAKRKEKSQKQQAAADEVTTRWYRKITRQTRSEYNAADFCAKILEDARREHHAKLRQKELHRRAINKKLQQLSLEAKNIIANDVGAYERGSFLLKIGPQKSKGKPKRAESEHVLTVETDAT